MALRETLAEQTGESWNCRGVLLVASENLGFGTIDAEVEGDGDVSFWARLTPCWDTSGWQPGGPGQAGKGAWDLEAEITVYTDENHDRGGDVVLELPARRYLSPEEAAVGFAATCAELGELALSRRPNVASWQPESTTLDDAT